jgi:Tfp pilus assembly protein PilX
MTASSRSDPRRKARGSGQSGAMFLYVVAGLVLFGILAVAATSFFSASSVGTALPLCSKNAQYVAEAGVRYAMNQLRTAAAVSQAAFTGNATALNNTTFTLNDGSTFTLSVPAPSGSSCTVTATGVSCKNTTPTSKAVTYTFAVSLGATGGPISFDDPGDMPGFVTTGTATGGGTPNPTMTVDPTGQTITFGNNYYEGYGCAWYTGTKTGWCVNGNCTLQNGFRAYFDISFNPASAGDGFVFGIISAAMNNASDCGGNPNEGELLAWAGNGVSGRGLRPPKLGVEFDTYYNTANANPCVAGSRNDPVTYNHVAAVYWGSTTAYSPSCAATFDDNVHGAGAGTVSQPTNPSNWNANVNGWDGVYYRTNTQYWMRQAISGNSTVAVRVELFRSTTPNALGYYCYTLKAWTKKAGDTIPAGITNVNQDYTPPPDMIDSVVLDSTTHGRLDNIFFGWTQATGAATQLGTISNFNLAFKSTYSCNSSIPTDYVAGWSMYEGTGTTLHNNATGGPDGTIDNARWVPGIKCPSCAALKFDRNNDGYVSVPDHASLDLTTAGSISAWVYIVNYNDQAGIVHKGYRSNWNDEAYSLQFDTNRRLALYVNQSNSQVASITSNTQLQDYTWYHVVGTWDANTLQIYLNGALDRSVPNTNHYAARNTTGSLQIGAQITQGSNHYTLDGVVDQVFLYNRVLTPTEVTAMYAAGGW